MTTKWKKISKVYTQLHFQKKSIYLEIAIFKVLDNMKNYVYIFLILVKMQIFDISDLAL